MSTLRGHHVGYARPLLAQMTKGGRFPFLGEGPPLVSGYGVARPTSWSVGERNSCRVAVENSFRS